MLLNSYDILLLRNMGSTNTPASSSAQSNNNYMHKTEFTWQVARRLAATPEGDGDGPKVSGDSWRWWGWPEGHSEGRLKLRDGVRITIRYKWASCTLQLVWNDSSPEIFLEYFGMSRVFLSWCKKRSGYKNPLQTCTSQALRKKAKFCSFALRPTFVWVIVYVFCLGD